MTERVARAWRSAGHAILYRLPWAARLQRQRKQQDSEELLRMASQVGRLGAWTLELDRDVVWWSDPLCAIFDVPPGTRCSVQQALAFCLPQSRRVIRAAVQACRGAGTPFDLELRIVTAQQRRQWVRIVGEAVRDDSGRIVRVQGAAQDIQVTKTLVQENARLQDRRDATEQDLVQLNAELEQRVQRRTAELERVNAELEAFTYSVAHDLRAPLRAISGFVEFLLERDPAEPPDMRARRYLQRIRTGAQQMDAMTGALLDLARLSHAALRPQRVDLARLAREAATDCAARFGSRNVPDFEVPPTLEVRGDAVLLRQVMENLVANAWKFSARQPGPRIALGARRERDGRRVFFVRDNGAGFDMDYASRLFEPFYRLHRQEEFEGTGVGLATVRKIIRMHGGDIWAEAAPGQGATFYFTLGN